MFDLSSKEIRLILSLLGEETIQNPTELFPYRISRKISGYSEDAEVGTLQAKLSIQLEAKLRMGK